MKESASTMTVRYLLAERGTVFQEATWGDEVVIERMKAHESLCRAGKTALTAIERDGLGVLQGIPLGQASLLDVGCGTGRWCRILSESPWPLLCWRYIGVEIDERRVALCRRLHPGGTFVTGTLDCLPRVDADIVICSGVLQYVRDWRGGLQALVRATGQYLAVLRLPVMKYQPTAICEQEVVSAVGAERHHSWMLNRGEFERCAEQVGLRLELRDYTEEVTRVEGMEERVFWLHYLFRRARDGSV